MRKCFFISDLLLYSIVFFGQNSESTHKTPAEKSLFSGSHFSFSVVPYLTQKAKIIRKSGNYSATSTTMHGIEAGGNYRINFMEAYSLIIGLHSGASARNYQLNISKEDYTPQLDTDVDDGQAVTREFDFYLSAPIWFEKRWQCKNSNHWNLLAGVNVRYYPSEFYEETSSLYNDVNGQQVEVLNLNLTIGNKNKPWLNYNVGGGYSLLLGNDNFLRFNVLANFSKTKLVDGNYIITVTGKEPSRGSYSANLSYFGLAFEYIFTGTNKRLRK